MEGFTYIANFCSRNLSNMSRNLDVSVDPVFRQSFKGLLGFDMLLALKIILKGALHSLCTLYDEGENDFQFCHSLLGL